MNDRALATLYVVGVWWLSTAVLLRMVWSDRATFRWSIGACSLLAVGGLVGLHASSRLASPAAAYVAFGCAILVWAWHELVFLLGALTGPRRTTCPEGAAGWRRFVFATEVVIHHEVALALTVGLIGALTWGQPNQVGAGTFLVLWLMRLSAKLNVFLGVRNLSEQFVPDHLHYLVSYFRRARLNPLMPASVAGASLVVAWLLHRSLGVAATPFTVVGHTLVAVILSLAVVEHLFLALPLPDAQLWQWAIRSRQASPLAMPSAPAHTLTERVASASKTASVTTSLQPPPGAVREISGMPP